ncbi:hypothetical protein MMAN_36660 [Mycobacterium mantenii]|uniref:Uncharacterized protein n=1 Tax=Mycobacterium mantenii TaxID=560555 RepID=A0ABM7JVC7_MYCNT|nr:hypothetical protein MMAN_36660 [Mycobacterium mantenii]
MAPLECPVWNATCVTTTPMAAQARMPSTAGRKLRTPPTRWSSLTITVCLCWVAGEWVHPEDPSAGATVRKSLPYLLLLGSNEFAPGSPLGSGRGWLKQEIEEGTAT